MPVYDCAFSKQRRPGQLMVAAGLEMVGLD